MNKDKLKKELLLIIYMFLLLFAPPLVKGINFLLILFAFSLIVILTKYRKQLFEFFKNKEFKKIGCILLGYYLWYGISIIINLIISKELYLYNYAINIYSTLLVIPIAFICCLHIVLYAKENDIKNNDLIKCLIFAGLIQSFFTVISVLFPSIKSFLIDIMYANTNDSVYLNQYHIERRFFGFANNMLDSFGFGTGILATLPLFYSIKNGKKWLISVPFLLLVPLMNSRTGLVTFGIGIVIWLIYLYKERKLRNYSTLFLSFIIMIVIILLVIYSINSATIDWIVNDFLSFFTDKKGTADVLFSENFWKMPSFFHIIIGKSHNVAAFGNMTSALGFSSDVGYVNEIWKTGLIGSVILIILLFKSIKSIYNKMSKEYQFFVISLVISILIANIKFVVFSYNQGIVILLLLWCFHLINEKVSQKEVASDELVSIVVPIYNVELYLTKCLDSLIKQTYQNIEIILVNDGSTDNSKQICLEYVNKDKRIKYIEKKNGGLSDARNVGIDNANGNYLVFVDSDDYVNVNFISNLYLNLKETNSDISVCSFKKVSDSYQDISICEENITKCYSGKSKFNNLYNDNADVTTVAWNKMYRKHLFTKIKYPKGKIHEDEFVIFDLLNNSSKIVYSSCEYYYYLQRDNSITATYNIKRTDKLTALKGRMKSFEKLGYQRWYDNTLYNYCYQLIYNIKMITRTFPNSYSKQLLGYKKELNNYLKDLLKSIYVNPLRKIKILIMKIMI